MRLAQHLGGAHRVQALLRVPSEGVVHAHDADPVGQRGPVVHVVQPGLQLLRRRVPEARAGQHDAAQAQELGAVGIVGEQPVEHLEGAQEIPAAQPGQRGVLPLQGRAIGRLLGPLAEGDEVGRRHPTVAGVEHHVGPEGALLLLGPGEAVGQRAELHRLVRDRRDQHHAGRRHQLPGHLVAEGPGDPGHVPLVLVLFDPEVARKVARPLVEGDHTSADCTPPTPICASAISSSSSNGPGSSSTELTRTSTTSPV